MGGTGMMGGGMPNGMMGNAGFGGMGPLGGGGGGGGGDGQAQISEEAYVSIWRNYSSMTGAPFDAQVVKGWYRQYLRSMGR
jgi:hypothetical protein